MKWARKNWWRKIISGTKHLLLPWRKKTNFDFVNLSVFLHKIKGTQAPIAFSSCIYNILKQKYKTITKSLFASGKYTCRVNYDNKKCVPKLEKRNGWKWTAFGALQKTKCLQLIILKAELIFKFILLLPLLLLLPFCL